MATDNGLAENHSQGDRPKGWFNYLDTGSPKQWKLFSFLSLAFHSRFSRMLSTMPNAKASVAARRDAKGEKGTKQWERPYVPVMK